MRILIKASDTRDVPRTGDNIHIPLETDEALRLALKVEPTKDMPRSGQAIIKRSQSKQSESGHNA